MFIIKKLILFGPPGAGKGTFSSQILKVLPDIAHISTGDIFRENLKNETPLGLRAKEYMDNKYISMEELERVFVMDDDELLIDTNLNSIITERIKIITQTFNTQAIQIMFDGESARLTAVTQARDQFAKIVSDIVTNAVLEKCSSNLSTVPFSIEHDEDVNFKIFKHPTQDVLMNRFATTLAELDVIIYGRAAIIKDED